MKKLNVPCLLFYILSAEAVGGLSALITGNFSSFFDNYKAPPLMPPGWLFPIVWVILYALMGYGAYLVGMKRAEPDRKRSALTIYWVQLAFNFSWSIIFFRLEWLWGAAAVILCLLALVGATVILFARVDKKSALINIPYFVWVAFATYLNFATAIIN